MWQAIIFCQAIVYLELKLAAAKDKSLPIKFHWKPESGSSSKRRLLNLTAVVLLTQLYGNLCAVIQSENFSDQIP